MREALCAISTLIHPYKDYDIGFLFRILGVRSDNPLGESSAPLSLGRVLEQVYRQQSGLGGKLVPAVPSALLGFVSKGSGRSLYYIFYFGRFLLY